ncbi:ORF3 [Bastrovirus 3]|nr:ORF3 [Bastrovirus 3]
MSSFSSPLWEPKATPTMAATLRVLNDLGLAPTVRSGCHRHFVPGGLGHLPHFVERWFYTIQIEPRPGTPAFPATITLAIGDLYANRDVAMSDAALQVDPAELGQHVLPNYHPDDAPFFHWWWFQSVSQELDRINADGP